MRPFLSVFLCLAIFASALWLMERGANVPQPAHAPPPQAATRPYLRIGFAAESSVFAQRKGYRALADYLERKLAPKNGGSAPVQLVTASSYAGVLRDFAEGKIDAAFMGSLPAVLAIDRHEGQVFLKSQGAGGFSTYSGVVFVLDGSPAKSFTDLAGKRLGAVRTTMSGTVYPPYLMKKDGMLADIGALALRRPTLVWSGTHDDVISEVVAGRLDGGAAKDVRLMAYQKDHPEVRLRKLAESGRVPDSALVVRRDYPVAQREAMVATLLGMADDPAAKTALTTLKIQRYVPCTAEEYGELYRMIESIGEHWSDLNIDGPIPQRPAPGTAHSLDCVEGG